MVVRACSLHKTTVVPGSRQQFEADGTYHLGRKGKYKADAASLNKALQTPTGTDPSHPVS